jgi:hypothetical protein
LISSNLQYEALFKPELASAPLGLPHKYPLPKDWEMRTMVSTERRKKQ